jgi:hypothetical protein
MRQEWAEHQAGAAAAHRHRAIEGFRAVRAALDSFNPDFILIWGDDRCEDFREDGGAVLRLRPGLLDYDRPRELLWIIYDLELLNWVCLAGATHELGRRPVWTDLAETYVAAIYAAPKAFAIVG